eukprot:TRINITY_DN3984_c0_g1_i1.p1 TRINITY_DN3984_c0_g1~~TRINITY_DN3984_c0_g1_i1.p1  ORF type:complete len:153 (-),score=39.76 TRINITY_DN3984_c0_g1_i1:213-671(-)
MEQHNSKEKEKTMGDKKPAIPHNNPAPFMLLSNEYTKFDSWKKIIKLSEEARDIAESQLSRSSERLPLEDAFAIQQLMLEARSKIQLISTEQQGDELHLNLSPPIQTPTKHPQTQLPPKSQLPPKKTQKVPLSKQADQPQSTTTTTFTTPKT